MADQVQIKGLREFRNAARKVSADMPKQMSRELKGVAEDVVAKARSKARGLPGKAGSAFAGGLRARADQTATKVILDGAKYPTLLGDEFGAKRFRQFQVWRGNQYSSPFEGGVGYALHPTIREHADDIERQIERLMDGWIAELSEGG